MYLQKAGLTSPAPTKKEGVNALRRIRMVLMSAAVMVMMVVMTAAPAMANDFHDGDGRFFISGDRFDDCCDHDGRFLAGPRFFDEDCEIEDVDQLGNVIFVVVECDD